jgi:serine-type D-Ala-D-Ala carboxypeptidase/endopeptidase
MSAARLALTIFALTVSPAMGRCQDALPSDSAITSLVEARVASGWTPGLVLGVIRPDGSTRVYSAGQSGTNRTLDALTLFEIGSITKAFTGILLADMVARSEVRLDEPVSALLPAGTRVPEGNGKVITLVDLSTQSSGLPRLPNNMPAADPTNPYADYTDSLLFAFLATYSLTRDIGAQYEYSNLGVGLLGNALARRAGTSYETLVTRRILEPVGMRDTRVTLTPELKARVAQGHDSEGKPASLWDLPALVGAGGLRSNAADMLKFLAANISGSSGTLGEALTLAREPRRPAGRPALRIGLGWHILEEHGNTIVWHNGGTGGFRTFAGYDPVRKIGVVVLSNSTNDSDDIAFHLLDSANALVAFRSEAQRQVSPEKLEAYVGEYQLAPAFSIVITREGEKLFGQATGQGRFQLYSRSEDDFYLRVVEARVVFERDAAGKVTGMVLHQNGQSIPGKKVP